ncbi:MAG: efflux RND transporter periplasmic adaptor subunit, partial [Victivallaceae bacterium]
NAKLKLSDTKIYADWSDGSAIRHVGDRYVDVGSLINTGKPILNIVEIDRIKVRVPVIERDYRYLKPGQTAEICADAYPDRTFTGTVMHVGNTLSEQTRNAMAVISIPNENLLLRPGMFVRVKIVLSEHENAQVVPLNSVVTKDGVQGIFGYDAKSESAKFIPVATGLSDKKIIEITSPELTMPVITIGNHLLEDGKKVAISELSRREIVEKKYRKNNDAKKSDSQNSQPVGE